MKNSVWSRGICVVLVLVLVMAAAWLPGAAAVAATVELHISSLIDGRSAILIQDGKIMFAHYDFDLPGHGNGQNVPTYLNDYAWFTQWDVMGSVRPILSEAFSLSEIGISLRENWTIADMIIIQSRGSVELQQEPDADNGYQAIIMFDDNPFGGASYYELVLLIISDDTEDETAPVTFTGTVLQYEAAGTKTPLANSQFNLYNKFDLLIETVSTDANGRFEYTTAKWMVTYNGVYASVTDKDMGTLLRSDESGFCTGRLYRLSQYRDNVLTYLSDGFKSETNGFRIAGRLVGDDGTYIAGASVRYIDEVAVSNADGTFSFYIDSDWLRYHSPRFYIVKDGYQRGGFYANITGTMQLLLNSGFIDVGEITLYRIAVNTPIEGSVKAWNQAAKIGDAVQVTVQYKTNETLADSVMTVRVPEGVVIVPGSASKSSALIAGNTLSLTETAEAGVAKTLLFWVCAQDGFSNSGFTIEAFIEANSCKWRIGSDSVILANLTLDVPGEINLDQDGNSLPFTVRGEAPSLKGYTVDVFVNNPNGERAVLNKVPTGLSAQNGYGRYQATGIYIRDAAHNVGEYAVTALLRDSTGEIADTKEAKIYVSPNAVAVTSIRMWSTYFDVKAPAPVSASSYVSACVYTDMNGANRDPIYAQVELDHASGISGARIVAITSAGVFPATDTRITSISANGHAVFDAYFKPGAILGTNIKVSLQLSWAKKAEASPAFAPMSQGNLPPYSPAIVTSPSNIPKGKVGQSYNLSIFMINAKPTEWNLHGILPEGLFVQNTGTYGNTASGISIIGTARKKETKHLTFDATCEFGKYSLSFTIEILGDDDPGEDDNHGNGDTDIDIGNLTDINDPSGYVYDIDTGKPIAGATVTLQAKNESGAWSDWDAENYYQHNYQITDAEGNYGWFVPQGQYRVLVHADGYEDYCTENDPQYGIITVLPPRDDIFIGLTKKPSAPVTSIKIVNANGPLSTVCTLPRNSTMLLSAVTNIGIASDVKFTVSDTSYANVDANGKLTTKNKTGAIVLTARTSNNISASVVLRIT